MGRPKALLDFDGSSCLELVLGACRAAGLGGAVVVTRSELVVPLEVHLSSRGFDAFVVVNEHPERGQTSSLVVGLRHLPPKARALLIFPVDFPLVTGTDLKRLCNVFAARWPKARVVAPSFQGRRGHPVVVDTALAPELCALPDGGSARQVLVRYAEETHHVTFDDDRVLTDMDTPEAYEACLARWRTFERSAVGR
jgi:molybdenum cofactor cytidylyltransferase